MKVLMIGLGSIGQRHLRNLKRLMGDNASFTAYRSRGLNITFSNDMKIREDVNLEDEYGIESFYDLDEALAQKPDVAFISNITSKHIECAMKVAEAGCDFFIEKPISHNLDGIDKLLKIIEEKKLIAFVGFQNRYHPCLNKLKEILKDENIGNVLSAEAVVGERLRTMHTYEDYRTTYMAKGEYGGGVILNQLIHELDYLQWIFGVPSSVYSVGGNLSDLEIDVEDMCEAVFSLNYSGKKIPIRVHADFLQYPPSRFCSVVCDNGKIKADIIANRIEWSIGDNIYAETFDDFIRNDMFISELKDFLKSVDERAMSAINLSDGVASLKMALAIKDSMKVNKTEGINYE